jgi:hypothetical protein
MCRILLAIEQTFSHFQTRNWGWRLNTLMLQIFTFACAPAARAKNLSFAPFAWEMG